MMLTWMDRKMIAASLKARKFLEEERGDTNFISIMIVLGVVIVVATTFLRYKDQIMETVDGWMSNFGGDEWQQAPSGPSGGGSNG